MQRSPKTPRRTRLVCKLRFQSAPPFSLGDASYERVNSEKYLENIYNVRRRHHSALHLSASCDFSQLLRFAWETAHINRISSGKLLGKYLQRSPKTPRRTRLVLQTAINSVKLLRSPWETLSYERVNSEKYLENIYNVRRRHQRRTTLVLQAAISKSTPPICLGDPSYQRVNSEKYVEKICNVRRRHHATLDLSCKLR